MRNGSNTPARVQSANSTRSRTQGTTSRRVHSAKERRPYSSLPKPVVQVKRPSNVENNESHQPIQRSLRAMSKYISTELPISMDHPALRGSLVMLPGLCDSYGQHLSAVPPPHDVSDDYPFTHQVPSSYVHKPKKYSHPYYERLKKMKGWTCNHSGSEVRVGSCSGETIHRFTINSQRSQSAVRDEIVELERLIKGLSTDWSTCTVALYQNEINDLQRKVKHTLSLTSPPSNATEVFDPTGLRGFCKEYDTALQALIERHSQCMTELKEMEEMQTLYAKAHEHLQ